MAASWDRRGWKTVAHVAVPLALIFGAVAVLQGVEMHTFQLQHPHSHRIHVPTDPKGPNWAEIAVAFLTLVLVVAALLALGAVRWARRAANEARRARNAVQMAELSRRWDEETNLEVRRQVKCYATVGVDGFNHLAAEGPYRLRESVMQLREVNAPDYRRLRTDPNFLEDLAILVNSGGMDFDLVNRSLGFTVAYRWSLWKPTVDDIRKEEREARVYIEFEGLAKRIAKANPDTVKMEMDDAGENQIVWEGKFRE